jgi:putative ABC transport system permease protein
VCIIDREIANQLYHRENVVGREVLLSIGGREEKFRIIGVVSKEDTLIGSLLGESAQFVYVPYTTNFELTGNTGFEAFLMSVTDNSSAELTAKKVIRLLEMQSDRSGFYYENLSKQQDTISSVIHTVTVIISAIAAISLIVGGVGVMTVMLVAVNERKQEIGIKKAIGATNTNIMVEFVTEAVTLTVLGGLMGTILGYLLSLAAKPILGIQSNFDINIAICALLFCAGIGIIFSVYPAKKAAQLNPIDCLKCE